MFKDLIERLNKAENKTDAILTLVGEINRLSGMYGRQGALAALVDDPPYEITGFCEFTAPEQKVIVGE